MHLDASQMQLRWYLDATKMQLRYNWDSTTFFSHIKNVWHCSAKLKDLSVVLLSQAPALIMAMSRMSSMPEPLPETRALANQKPRKLDTEWKTEFRLGGPRLTTLALDKKTLTPHQAQSLVSGHGFILYFCNSIEDHPIPVQTNPTFLFLTLPWEFGKNKKDYT